MGAQLRYGTAGATGGGWSAQPGTLQPALEESWHQPLWQWQARAPKTWKDKNWWRSCWSFGCRTNGGGIGGLDGASAVGQSMSDINLYEPYSCDGDGTQSLNWIRGTCYDATAAISANATVQAFETATDIYKGEGVSLSDGTYYVGVTSSKLTPHYLVAYKSGSPDIAGTTVNTLLPTNIDGT